MGRKRTTRKPVKRTTRHFQLRVDHPEDSHVAEILDFKRGQRAEVTTIRNGVRLLWALENGDTSVLFEMFPHLKPQLAPSTPGGAGGGAGGELQEIKAMLEMVVSQQSSGGYQLQSVKPATTGAPRALDVPKLAMPVFDDDDDDMPTLIIQKSTNTDASANLLKAMSNLF